MDSSKSDDVDTNKPISGEEREKMRKEKRVDVWGASESCSTQEKRSKFESLESTRRNSELSARLTDLANLFRRHDHEPKEEIRKEKWLSERKERTGSESEVESAESCYTSNCECWLVYLPSLDVERRKTADPLGRPGQARLKWFVSDRNTPKVRLLGSFRKDSDTQNRLEAIDLYEWYEDLVFPGDDEGGSDIIHIPPPPPPPTSTILLPLPLFSLTRLIHSSPQIDDDGVVLESGVYEDVGMSYSLPLYPPPSELIPSQEHPIPDDVYDVTLIGSSNGLYCLRSGPVRMEVSVIVWNPTTAVSRQLPPFSCSYPDGLIFGFGYDHSSDDYKVVKIDADTLEVEVFSLYSNSNENSWRTVHAFPQRCNFQRYFCNGAVSVAGCLNWLVSADDQARVASFNLATETFGFLPLPPTYGTQSHSFKISSLWILDGCLSFVTIQGFSPDWRPSWRYRVFDIWIMREYGVESSWINAATVMFPQSVLLPYRILYLSKDIMILDVRLQPSRLFVFNIKENSLVCPHIQGATKRRGGVEPYVRSKVSPYFR